MALAHPHGGMARVLAQAVAVALLLCVQHEAVQFLCGGDMGLAGLNDGGFEQIAAVDIHHGLGGLHQAVFQQHKTGRVVGAAADSLAQQGLVEDGSRLGQRHGRLGHQHGHRGQAAVMPRVAQLMSQRAHVGEAAHKIGQHPALVVLMEALAERAAFLALGGEEVDPVVAEGFVHQGGNAGMHLGEGVDQQVVGFVHRIAELHVAHRGEQIIEGQAIGMAQHFRLAAQVAAEIRQCLPDGGQHGFQRFPLHAGFGQLLGQQIGIAPRFAQRHGLTLDGGQAEGHGRFHLGIGLEFGLVGLLPHLGVGIVGHAAHSGQRQAFAVQFHRMAAHQAVTQLGESVSAVQ